MLLSHTLQVRGLQIINHVLLLVGVYIAWSDPVWLLISLLVYWTVGVLGINIGYHRLLSHRSFQTNYPLEVILILLGSVTAIGSPLAWVGIHRQHHQYTDRPGDPHSPILLGKIKAWFGIWGKIRIDARMTRDLRQSRVQRFLHKHYLLINLSYCTLLFLINPLLVIFVYAIPACCILHSANAVVALGHSHGYRSYNTADQSTNSWIVNILTLGDGWHNNHHAHPWEWSTWKKWWEWDIPACVIWIIKK